MSGYTNTPPAVQTAIEAQREEFEEKMYREFFIAHVKADLTLSEDIVDKETFFTRDPEDAMDYARPELSAMWFGWLLARGLGTT